MASKAERERKRKGRLLADNQNKGGRPQREGAEVRRYPNNRINYRAMESEAKVKSTVTEARKRQHGCTVNPDRPEWGYALGRLYLSGALGALETDPKDEKQGEAYLLLDAGNRMHRDFEAYYAVTGMPTPSPRALDMTRVRGLGGADRQDEARRATARMMAIEGALAQVDEQGKPVMQLVKRLIIKDEDTRSWTPAMVRKVKRGLAALVEYYGLGTRRDAAQALVSARS